MLQLPANMIAQLNTMNQTDPWILLLDLYLGEEGGWIYIARNNEIINFNGKTYYPVEFNITAATTTADGTIPTITLSISNETKILQGYVEQYEGLPNGSATLRLVYAGNLTADTEALNLSFAILGIVADEHFIAVNLGTVNLLNRKVPTDLYLAYNCRFKFKSIECGYTGTGSTCNKTLVECQNYENALRFGGCVGLGNGGYRVV